MMPIGRRIQRVPAHQHGAGLLVLVEPQEQIREADDGAAALVAAPAE
jgi:hypothetical protein